MKRELAVLAMVTTMLGGAAACSSSGGKRSGIGGTLHVDAAASLTEAFDTIKAQFEKAHKGVQVVIKYGASSDLETQINNGDKVDVFASASPKNIEGVKVASAPQNFVVNTAEIATPPNNPAHISSIADLAKSGVKVAVCAPAVPCGALALQIFKNAKISVKPSAQEKDVKTTLSLVLQNEADAAVVYVTDVRAAGSKVHGVPIADDVNASTEYPIATLKGADNPDTAKAFIAYVQSAAGQKVLIADGFHKP